MNRTSVATYHFGLINTTHHSLKVHGLSTLRSKRDQAGENLDTLTSTTSFVLGRQKCLSKNIKIIKFFFFSFCSIASSISTDCFVKTVFVNQTLSFSVFPFGSTSSSVSLEHVGR
jgi:hypothetical protein